MPTSFVGLVLFVVFLTPGYVYFTQRRSVVSQPDESALVELVSLIGVSVLTNAMSVAVFAFVRFVTPEHTPDVRTMVEAPSDYVEGRPGYILIWGGCFLLLSCIMAFVAGRARFSPFNHFLSPVIVPASAWHHVFENRPRATKRGWRSYPYISCEMEDGSFVGGRLTWYNTDVEETADRELALVSPLEVLDANGEKGEAGENDIIILSARRMKRLSVTWVDEQVPEERDPWWHRWMFGDPALAEEVRRNAARSVRD